MSPVSREDLMAKMDTLEEKFTDHQDEDRKGFKELLQLLNGDGEKLGVFSRLHRMEQSAIAHRKGVRKFLYWLLTPILTLVMAEVGVLLWKLISLNVPLPPP